MMFRTITFLLILFLFSCKESIEVITLEKRDSIPEGIAVHESQDVIYLSNLYTRNIIQFKENGSQVKVINSSQRKEPFGNGVGIEQTNGKIYALSNTQGNGYYSYLDIYDATTLELLSQITYSDTVNSFFNDLAVTETGEIYITNTGKNSIHYLNKNKASFLLSNSEEIEYPNGIALSEEGNRLYIASFTKGIRVYDLLSNQFLNEPDTTGLTGGIDGMKLYRNSIIAVKNGSLRNEEHAVLRFFLDDAGINIIKTDTLLINHPKFNIPTTLDIKDDWVFCLANSQMDNLDENWQLIRKEELTYTYILKFKLD